MQNNQNIPLEMSEILAKVPNKFLLSVAVAKRARQIREGMSVVEAQHEEIPPVLRALAEVQAGLLKVKMRENIEPHVNPWANRNGSSRVLAENAKENAKAEKKAAKDALKESKRSKAKSLAA